MFSIDRQKWYDHLDTITTRGVRPPIAKSKIEDFKEDVIQLCKKYDVTLYHEDIGGAFCLVSGYDEVIMEWFNGAYDCNRLRGLRYET